MNLELLDKKISQFSFVPSAEITLQDVKCLHDHLNELTKAVATEWSDTEEARMFAWSMVQEKINQLRLMLLSMQEATLADLKQIYRSKKSIKHYHSAGGE